LVFYYVSKKMFHSSIYVVLFMRLIILPFIFIIIVFVQIYEINMFKTYMGCSLAYSFCTTDSIYTIFNRVKKNHVNTPHKSRYE